MSDYNVTFAGLPLESPIIIETTTDALEIEVADRCRESGAGGVLFPVLDEERLNRVLTDDELTEHNRNDRTNRDSQRVLRSLNIDEYMDALEELTHHLEIPVIGALQCDRKSQWFSLAHLMKEAGAKAVEIRPYRHDVHRHLRSDQIEKTILRITASISDRVDIPLIVRVPAFMHGLHPFMHALGETGAAAVVIEPPEIVQPVDAETLTLTTAVDDRGAFLTSLSTCRALYRRINTHIAVQVPRENASTLVTALIGGATAVTLPVDGSDREETPELVRRYLTYLKKWMTSHSFTNLFDFRGVVSESRLQSSLEN